MPNITETARRIRAIAAREVRTMTSRWGIYLYSMLLAAIISAVFFLSLMDKGLPTDMPVAVVDMDNSTVSRNIVRQLDAFQQTDVKYISADFSHARELMQEGKVYGIMVLPEGLGRDAAGGAQPKITYYTNNSYLIAGSLLYRDMRMMSVLASGAVQLETGKAKGRGEAEIMAQVQPIVIDTHPIGNPWLNYSVYLCNVLLPGVLGLMIFLVTVYSIGSEIKYGTSGEYLSMANGSMPVALAGKLLPQTAVFYGMGLVLIWILYGVMDFPHNSGVLPMMLLMLVFVLAAQGMGVFMIGVLPNVRLGMSFASLWGVISFSISGFTFPVAAMDPTLQALSNLFPLRHYFLVYVDQALNGLPLHYSAAQLLALGAFCLLPFLLLKPLKRALETVKYSM